MSGEKTFELRKNDRRFKVGDVLRLREWEPTKNEYSGRECTRVITYVLEGVGPGGITPYHGLAREYAILGLSALVLEIPAK
jgi:hypothetical protein